MYEQILMICRTVNPTIPDDEQTMLFDGGYIDSFGAYAILVQLEMDFNIHITEDDLKYENFKSIKAIVNLVERKSGNDD